ncbi:MAG TPA: ABC transporter permease [Gaiellaceae bacterium]|nr:ABC transporter permease [Gaiellaceae bacterium]
MASQAGAIDRIPAFGGVRRPAGAGFVTATAQTARRTLLQFARTPQLLVMPPVTAALFMVIFRYVFGGAINPGGHTDYVHFLIPGFVAQAFLWNVMNIPAGVAEDATSGLHDRLRSLPIPRASVMAGRSLADTLLNVVPLGITVGLGFAVGFRTDAGAGAVLGALAVILAAIYAFSWLFIGLGLVAGNAQAAQAFASLVVIPLTFVSGAFVPVGSMPGWLQWFAANQPVTAVINAVRSLMLGGTDVAGIGHTTSYWVVLSLLWCAGILALFGVLTTARFARTR